MAKPTEINPFLSAPFVDKEGNLASHGRMWLQQYVYPTVANKTDVVANAENQVSKFDSDGNLATSGKSAPTGSFVGDTDAQTLANKTLTQPAISDFSQASHNHQDTTGAGQLNESALAFTDVATTDSSTSKHGLLPKLSGSANDLLNGSGAWATGYTGSITVVTGVGPTTTKTLTFTGGQLVSVA